MRSESLGTGPATNLHLSVALIAFCAAFASVPTAFAQKIVERDSAGIRIVENPSREATAINFFVGNVLLDIGGAKDDANDELKTNSVWSVRLNANTIVVTENRSVGLFDNRGKRIASIGREGAGPGEFRSADKLCKTRGDTVVVNDVRNGRFAVIHGQRVVRTTLTGTYGSSLAGCFDDGTVLLTSTPFSDGSPSSITRLNRVTLNGTLVNTFPSMTFQTSHAVTHSLLPRITVRGQRVYAGDGATSEVRVYSANARLMQIIRTADLPKRITAADAERALATASPRVKNSPRPEFFPTFAQLQVDERGRLWVQDYVQRPPEFMHWTVFDFDGRLLGRIKLPGPANGTSNSVISFEANAVQLYHFDADGFAHLQYRTITQR